MNGEQKKFLDENGLKILWNQISIHDYPNNAALTSVINAIDVNKADKADIPRIDTTLSAAGAAADAKAVGQAIENIELTPGPKGDIGATGPAGKDGVDGITPHVGANGNWFIGDTDTGISSRGETGVQGPQGEKGETGNSGVHTGSEPPTDDDVNVWINPDAKGDVLDFIPTPNTASVGQTIVVKEVDENGKPILWEAADFPSGGSNSFRTLITVEEDTAGGLVVSVPVSWENILQYNIHFVFPEPIAVTEASKFNVKVFDRHWSGNIDKTTQVNLYGVRYGYDGNRGVVSVTMTTSPDWFGTAMPDMVTGTQNYYYVGGENYTNGEDKRFLAWIANGLPIPAGTLIEVWGVYVS